MSPLEYSLSRCKKACAFGWCSAFLLLVPTFISAAESEAASQPEEAQVAQEQVSSEKPIPELTEEQKEAAKEKASL